MQRDRHREEERERERESAKRMRGCERGRETEREGETESAQGEVCYHTLVVLSIFNINMFIEFRNNQNVNGTVKWGLLAAQMSEEFRNVCINEIVRRRINCLITAVHAANDWFFKCGSMRPFTYAIDIFCFWNVAKTRVEVEICRTGHDAITWRIIHVVK